MSNSIQSASLVSRPVEIGLKTAASLLGITTLALGVLSILATQFDLFPFPISALSQLPQVASGALIATGFLFFTCLIHNAIYSSLKKKQIKQEETQLQHIAPPKEPETNHQNNELPKDLSSHFSLAKKSSDMLKKHLCNEFAMLIYKSRLLEPGASLSLIEFKITCLDSLNFKIEPMASLSLDDDYFIQFVELPSDLISLKKVFYFFEDWKNNYPNDLISSYQSQLIASFDQKAILLTFPSEVKESIIDSAKGILNSHFGDAVNQVPNEKILKLHEILISQTPQTTEVYNDFFEKQNLNLKMKETEGCLVLIKN